MERYALRNGWTKQAVKEALLNGNNGTLSISGGICIYRGEGNNKCAAGCFIPDYMYSLTMEGTPIAALMHSREDLAQVMPFSSTVMSELQRVHDNRYFDCNTHLYKPGQDVLQAMLNWVDNNVEDKV